MRPEFRAAALAVILVTAGCGDNTRTVNLDRLPVQLPAAVEAAIPSVVDLAALVAQARTEYSSAGYSTILLLQKGSASGVKVEDGTVLTAGDFLNRYTNVYTCGDVNVNGVVGNDGNPTSATVTGAVSSYSADPSVPNVALLSVASSETFADLPNAKVSDHDPNRGDELFLINYQTDPAGRDRNPANFYNDELAEPAIYAGILVGEGPTGDYIVLTSVKSYGETMIDKSARQGAQGGAVLNKQGEIVGIPTTLFDQQLTAKEIEKRYKIKLKGEGAQEAYVLTHVQPIRQSDLANRKVTLALRPDPCIPTPPLSVIRR